MTMTMASATNTATPAAPGSAPDLTSLVVRALVLYALAEHQAGHATVVHVTAEGRSFSVQDNGRGHAIDKRVDGTPYLPLIYEQLRYPFAGEHTLGDTRDVNSLGGVQLQGIGMSLLNSLCSTLQVTVRKADATLTLHYVHGQLQARQRQHAPDTSTSTSTSTNTSTGNRVQGQVSPALAPHGADQQALHQWLATVQAAAPGLQLSFNGQALAPPA